MATAEERARIRRLTDEPTAELFSDDDLDIILSDNSGNFRAAIVEVWESKAARSVNLVDMSEGQSSRKLSQAGANALRMAGVYRTQDDSSGPSGNRRPAHTSPIERT